MLQGLVLANSHFFTESKTEENLQRGLFFIDDAGVMLALEPLGMTMYVHKDIPLLHINQPSDRFNLITY